MKGPLCAALCALLALSPACGTLEISVERTATPGLDATSTIAALQVENARLATQVSALTPPTSTSMPLPQPTPGGVLGGGTVFDGPFIFELRIFREPSSNPHPVAASLYSDLDGIGAWMYWFYKGADPIGPVETYWGTMPQVVPLVQETYPRIQTGSSGGRSGGIQLPGGFFMPGESKAGDRVSLVLKVVTHDGEYGALLLFTLRQGVNGFEPIDISVDVLRSAVIPTP